MGFNISRGIAGSPHLYHILYTDPVTNFKCGLAVVSPQLCINGSCEHMFNVSSTCPNSIDIIVTVSGFNTLGEGKKSAPVVVPGLFT